MAAAVESAGSGSEVSGLDFEETELKLALPGGGRAPGAEGDRKRGFEETVQLRLGGGGSGGARASAAGGATQSAAESMESKVTGSAKAPAAKTQVVGWPPVRASMRNALKARNFVKVAVDGAPYLRKVDLELYTSYDQLLAALEDMFSCFTIRNYLNEGKLVDPVNGTEFVPTYKDKEGDWMLVGDVPWKMFVETCKRLRLMKSSEAVNLAPRTPEGSSNAG